MSESRNTDENAGQAEGGQLARRAGTVAAFTLGSRVLGYARDAALANIFGAGVAFDAFVAAQTIPNALRRLVAEGTLMIAYVPLLTEEREKGGLIAMRRFTAAVLAALIPVLVLLVSLGVFFPEVGVKMFASGFGPERAELAAHLTQIMMPFLFFVSLVAVASGALNTVGIFAAPAAAPICLNIAIISCVLFFNTYFEQPIYAAAWGVLLGGIAQLLLQIPFLVRKGLLVAPSLELSHPAVRELGRRMLPAVFGVGVYQLNIIVIRQIASFLPHGQLSCYFFASRLEEFALGVFAISISVAALPTMSDHAARKDASALLQTFGRAIRATTFITVPAMAALFVLAVPIVGTLFSHGHFDDTAARTTSSLVQIMAFALVPIGAVRVIVPTYYAFGDTRTPVLAATASLLTTAGVGAGLSPIFQIHGLTLATVLAASIQLLILSWLLTQRLREQMRAEGSEGVMREAILHAIRCVTAVVPAALIVGWLSTWRTWIGGENLENLIYLGGLGGGMGGVYLAISYKIGIAESGLILAALKRRLTRLRRS